jgi:hypothetical protein
VVFSASGCCMCHVVKRLLLGLGVGPTVYELDQMVVGSGSGCGGREIQAALAQLLPPGQPPRPGGVLRRGPGRNHWGCCASPFHGQHVHRAPPAPTPLPTPSAPRRVLVHPDLVLGGGPEKERRASGGEGGVLGRLLSGFFLFFNPKK